MTISTPEPAERRRCAPRGEGGVWQERGDGAGHFAQTDGWGVRFYLSTSKYVFAGMVYIPTQVRYIMVMLHSPSLSLLLFFVYSPTSTGRCAAAVSRLIRRRGRRGRKSCRHGRWGGARAPSSASRNLRRWRRRRQRRHRVGFSTGEA